MGRSVKYSLSHCSALQEQQETQPASEDFVTMSLSSITPPFTPSTNIDWASTVRQALYLALRDGTKKPLYSGTRDRQNTGKMNTINGGCEKCAMQETKVGFCVTDCVVGFVMCYPDVSLQG